MIIKLPHLSPSFPFAEVVHGKVDGQPRWIVYSDTSAHALILGMDEEQDKAIEKAADTIAMMNY